MTRRVSWREKIYWFDEDGLLHREDGPAREWENGIREWFQHGLRHRTDGPAIEWPLGEQPVTAIDHLGEVCSPDNGHRMAWYVNNKKINIEPILERLGISPDWKSWTDEEKFLVRLALP